MEVFILLPGVSGRAMLSRTGCGVSSYTTLGVEGGGPPAAGGVDIGVKSSGVGSSRSREICEIWSLGGEGGRVGGVSDGRALWPSEPSLGGAVARGAAGAPSTRPRPPATLRPPSTMGGRIPEKIPGEEVPEREGLERGEIWPELMGGDLEEMRRSAGRARTGDPRVADLIRGDRPWGDLPREEWEDVGGGTPRATVAERRASAAAVAARVRIPGPSDVARERRGSAPVLDESPLRGIVGRITGEPLGDVGRRIGVDGRKLGERCGVIRPGEEERRPMFAASWSRSS